MSFELLVIDRIFGKKIHDELDEHLDAVIYLLVDYTQSREPSRTYNVEKVLYYLLNEDQIRGAHYTMLSFLRKLTKALLSDAEMTSVVSTQEPFSTVE